MPYKVVLIFEPADEIRVQFKWKPRAVLSCGTVCNSVQGGTKFIFSWYQIFKCDHSGMKGIRVLSRGPNI